MEELGQGTPFRESSERSEVLWPRSHLPGLSDATIFITNTGESQGSINVKGETGVVSGTGALNTPH